MIRCLTRIHKSIQLSFGFSDLDSTMNRIKKKKLFPKTEIVSLNSTCNHIMEYRTVPIGHHCPLSNIDRTPIKKLAR